MTPDLLQCIKTFLTNHLLIILCKSLAMKSKYNLEISSILDLSVLWLNVMHIIRYFDSAFPCCSVLWSSKTSESSICKLLSDTSVDLLGLYIIMSYLYLNIKLIIIEYTVFIKLKDVLYKFIACIYINKSFYRTICFRVCILKFSFFSSN